MRKLLEKLGFFKTNQEKKYTNPNLIFQETSYRLTIFGIAISLAMLLVFGKIFQVQVLKKDHYTEALENYTRRYQTITTPRGEIYDRNGEKVVANKIIKSIIYYPPADTNSKEQWELARKFAQNFEVDESLLNDSDLKDMALFLNKEEIYDRVDENTQKKYEEGGYTEAEYYKIVKNLVTDDDISGLSKQDRKSYLVYQAMTLPTAGSMKTILSDVSNKEISYLAEHNLDYPGFKSFSGWDRDFLKDHGLKSLVGKISSEKQGIPAEKDEYYLAKGYSRDEKTGRSGLELYYEDLLSGNRTIQDVQYSEDGFANPIDVKEGTKGKNLILSIDAGLQEKTEEIVIRHFEENKDNPLRKYMNDIYVVVSEPNSGEVMALAGVKKDGDGDYFNDPTSAYLDSIEPGSIVKGAVVYLGLDSGVVTKDEQISDAPIKIKGTEEKKSAKPMVSNNAVSALAHSSNVYMFHIAMRVANASYQYDQPLYGVDRDDFNILRENFSRFGLGGYTGIDAVMESTGYVGDVDSSGLLLDYSMGQYDTYTPMQMAQYLNMIANGGYRVAPKLVKEAKDPYTDITVFENKTNTIGYLENKEALTVVQQGFRNCVTEGICQAHLRDLPYEVAAKTGTAETTVMDNGVSVDAPNSLLVTYAPFDDPEISIVIAVRNSMNDRVLSNITQSIAAEIYEYYFENTK